jgi:hypothetical protein
MWRRYVCAGIVVLALGSTVRAEDAAVIGKITSASSNQVRITDSATGQSKTYSVTTNTKVIKLRSASLLTIKGLKQAIKGPNSTIEKLAKLIGPPPLSPSVDGVVSYSGTTATGIGYFKP